MSTKRKQVNNIMDKVQGKKNKQMKKTQNKKLIPHG